MNKPWIGTVFLLFSLLAVGVIVAAAISRSTELPESSVTVTTSGCGDSRECFYEDFISDCESQDLRIFGSTDAGNTLITDASLFKEGTDCQVSISQNESDSQTAMTFICLDLELVDAELEAFNCSGDTNAERVRF